VSGTPPDQRSRAPRRAPSGRAPVAQQGTQQGTQQATQPQGRARPKAPLPKAALPKAPPRPSPRQPAKGNRPEPMKGAHPAGPALSPPSPSRPAPPSKSRRPRWGRRIAIGLLLVVIGAGMAVLRQATLPDVVVSVRSTPGSARIDLVSGDADLGRLARALADQGYQRLLVRSGDGWLLTRTLIVRPGAELDVGGRLRLLSEPDGVVGLEARGGRLNIADAVVTSWDRRTRSPDKDVSDGRAFVLARDRGSMDVLDSRMEQLGYAANERYGVAWRLRGTTGEVRGSTFTGNYYGLYTFQVDGMRIRDSVFERSYRYGLDPHSGSRGFLIENNHVRDNGKHGILLAVGCTSAVVRNNQVYRNREHGIVVYARSDDALIQDNEVRENGQAGIDVNDSARTRVRGNLAYANWTGLFIHNSAAGSTIEGNRLSANRVDGLRLSSDARIGAVRDNIADYNYRAGAYLDGVDAKLGPGNQLVSNEFGVWLSGKASNAAVAGNTIGGNVLDGVHLPGNTASAAIRGNTIRSNGKAAFSVEVADASRRFASTNTIAGNSEGLERLRGTE
jgi:parallel beta-helix repeat protein